MQGIQRLLFLVLSTAMLASSVQAQDGPLKKLNNKAFKEGEFLKFRVHYGFVDAGYATMEIKKDLKKFAKRDCYHIVGIGESARKFDLFFKIRDRYESYLDVDAIVPWFHVRNVKEGSFKKFETDNFNHYTNTVTNEVGSYRIPDQVQDLLTSYYYTRVAFSRDMKEGDVIPVKAFFDNEVNAFTVRYLGHDLVKTKVGKIRCLKFRPTIFKGRAFKDQEDMTIWVTDDDNYALVRVEAKLIVGSVKVDLEEYSGLANPFTALIKK